MRVNANAIACRTTEQLINGHAEEFPFNVPERLLDSTERAREDRSAAVECVPVNRLPVMNDEAWILPNQIGLDFRDGSGAGLRAPFRDWFAQANQSLVSVHFQK
jgi:hypothetical protein